MKKVFTLLIDDADLHLIAGRRVFSSGGYPAIYPGTRLGKKLPAVRLHVLIMRPQKGMGVDHRNRNKWDARRSNLRVCTQSDNCLNVGARKDSKSGIRGVWFDKARGQWAAQISYRGQRFSLGRFDTKRAAAGARKSKQAELWGEFAPQ